MIGRLNLHTVIVCFLACCSVPVSPGQPGTLSGMVLEASGAAVPGATVVATHAGTGVETRTATTSTGAYSLPYLPAGVYTLRVTAPGFRTTNRQRVVLGADQVLTVNVTLELGVAAEQAAVGAARSLPGLVAVTAPTSGAHVEAAPACDAARSTELARRARTAVAGGDASMAGKLFLDAHDACPVQPFLLVEAARALTTARRFDQALAALDRFLRDHPNSVEGRVARANALLMAQRWAECGAEIEQALQIGRDHRDLLLLKAHYEYLVGESGKAEQTLLRLLDLYPEDEEAAYALGRIYYMDSRIDYASAQFQRVLRLNAGFYKAWNHLGLCYDAAGETDKAVQHFLKAIELAEKADPGYDSPYGNLADLLFRQNDFERSYHAAVQAAKRNPYSARNFYLGGKALARLNRNEEAIHWLERSAALDPAYPNPLYLLGQLYMKMGRKDKGFEALEKFRQVKAKAAAQGR